MKAAKDAGEKYCDSTREDNVLVRNKTRSALLGRAPQRSNCGTGEFVFEVWARVLCGGTVLHWVALASSNSYGRSRSGRGRCPNLDPMDRTASMEWNVPGTYGPHGELFFFLIQKEPATVPGSEIFSPLFNADIRTPSSLLMSSRSVRLLPYP